MGLLSELRNPTRWYTQLIIALLTLAIFTLLSLVAISGYELYRIISPAHSHSEIDLQNFPGHPEILSFTDASQVQHDGWFFPGFKAAPTIVLCPGYQSSRGELLTLASALQEHQYNVFLVDFSGQGSSARHSTLGFQEVGELRAAMDAVANRGDVDVNRFGLWGANLGAYVALFEATQDPRVRALAVESPYDAPRQMAGYLVRRSGLGRLPLVTRFVEWEFAWMNNPYRRIKPLTMRVSRLNGVDQLYLQPEEESELADATRQIFVASPEPHNLVPLAHGNYAGMLDDEKRVYENRILSFFLLHLPASGQP
jgi:pimeloyl-ACP methyl ester carboxylesterase